MHDDPCCGYDPCTITDFEIPKKYGLRQTIADTLGVGGVFRALRTIPVMLDFARDMEDVCPDAWLLECTRDGVDLYPEIKRRAKLYNEGKLDIGSWEARLKAMY